MSMPGADPTLLDALLDSWDRGNRILLNLLHALSPQELDSRALEGSPSAAELYAHLHGTRLFWLEQTAPEAVGDIPALTEARDGVQVAGRDPQRIASALGASARAVREAVRGHIESGQPLAGPHASYDHPVLLLQHLLWHEGYHVGQLKLALKRAGRVLSDAEEEGLIWGVWRREHWQED